MMSAAYGWLEYLYLHYPARVPGNLFPRQQSSQVNKRAAQVLVISAVRG